MQLTSEEALQRLNLFLVTIILLLIVITIDTLRLHSPHNHATPITIPTDPSARQHRTGRIHILPPHRNPPSPHTHRYSHSLASSHTHIHTIAPLKLLDQRSLPPRHASFDSGATDKECHVWFGVSAFAEDSQEETRVFGEEQDQEREEDDHEEAV